MIGQNDLLLGNPDEGDYDNVPSPRPLASAASHHSCNSSLSSIHSTSQSEATILFAKPLPKHNTHNQHRWVHRLINQMSQSSFSIVHHFLLNLGRTLPVLTFNGCDLLYVNARRDSARICQKMMTSRKTWNGVKSTHVSLEFVSNSDTPIFIQLLSWVKGNVQWIKMWKHWNKYRLCKT